MTDRPIIFSAPMVRALLDGRKTMTRRLASSPLRRAQPGDRLWVREAWRTTDSLDHLRPAEMGRKCIEAGYLGPWAPILYVADNAVLNWEGMAVEGRHRASMHMPRWLSRITLQMTAIKVERLQEITEADARAEGVLYVSGHGEITPFELRSDPGYSNFLNCRLGFWALWNELHGPGAWEANPEVVAISFLMLPR